MDRLWLPDRNRTDGVSCRAEGYRFVAVDHERQRGDEALFGMGGEARKAIRFSWLKKRKTSRFGGLIQTDLTLDFELGTPRETQGRLLNSVRASAVIILRARERFDYFRVHVEAESRHVCEVLAVDMNFHCIAPGDIVH